jgi:flagellar biosynthesis protein FliP
VVQSLLRTALGTATLPLNSLSIAPVLFLTPFVRAGSHGRLRRPFQAGDRQRDQRERGVRARLRAAARIHGEKRPRKGSAAVCGFVRREGPQKLEDLSMRILIPAFMISELKAPLK